MTNKFNKIPGKTYFGLPSGSLNKKTVNVLTKSGLLKEDPGRKYEVPSAVSDDLVFRVLDRKEMPNNVANGVVDAGITGSDYIAEAGFEQLPVVADLVFSKKTNKPSRLVLASDPEIIAEIEACRGKVIATELPNLTSKKLQELCGFNPDDINIYPSEGKTEAKAIFGLADAFTDITETGSTLKANGFQELATLYKSNPQLILSPEAIKDTTIRNLIEEVAVSMLAVLSAEKEPLSFVSMNVPKDKLDQVKEFLPADVSPTVSDTANSNWLALNVLVPKRLVNGLALKLLGLGVRGITPTNVGVVFSQRIKAEVADKMAQII